MNLHTLVAILRTVLFKPRSNKSARTKRTRHIRLRYTTRVERKTSWSSGETKDLNQCAPLSTLGRPPPEAGVLGGNRPATFSYRNRSSRNRTEQPEAQKY